MQGSKSSFGVILFSNLEFRQKKFRIAQKFFSIAADLNYLGILDQNLRWSHDLQFYECREAVMHPFA